MTNASKPPAPKGSEPSTADSLNPDLDAMLAGAKPINDSISSTFPLLKKQRIRS